jgi:hypothetical protein
VAFGKVNANFTELYARPIGGSAAGSTNYIQYNSSGAFAASIKYQWDDAANTMTFATGASSVTSYIKAAPTTTGDGNALAMVASDGSTDNGADGGSITLTAGNGLGDYSGTGDVIGGNISLHAGYCDPAGFADSGIGGNVGLYGGDGYGNSEGRGGAISLQGGTGTGVLAGNGGSIGLVTGGSNTHASGNMLFNTSGTYNTTPGRIDFQIGGNQVLGISATRNVSISTPPSGVTLAVAAGAASQLTLLITGNGAGGAALGINASATSAGTRTATFSATNKPGTNNQTTPATWLPINLGGTVYYIPCFAA